MARIKMFQIDAFADQPFGGNPAAVCLMEQAAEDEWLQAVAAEMNLSETAFVWRRDDDFHLRWFTPAAEVDLCGHATLATAHALWQSGWLTADRQAEFETRSGRLTAQRSDDGIYLDFPAQPPSQTDSPHELQQALPVNPVYVGRNKSDYLIQVASEAEVHDVTIDFRRLGQIEGVRGVILTAAADQEDVDFVSRFFAPAFGIDEDPVTGSAHCCLAPFWSNVFGKTDMIGYQASKRGGTVRVQLNGDRVMLGGHAVTILEGSLLA